MENYDVIVIGGGHAGCEAALASARMKCNTLLLTINLDTIALMPCNPAIGGSGKSQVIAEIDALGGEIAINAEKALTQIRILNTSKGLALRSKRAQCDKKLYSMYMKETLEKQSYLHIFQTIVSHLIIDNNTAIGVVDINGEEIYGKTIIVTTGTFLNGRIHVGHISYEAGRSGEISGGGISNQLKDLGFDVKRFNTGTTPRLDRKSVDYSKFEIQEGIKEPINLSFKSERRIFENQLPSYLGWTNEKTMEITKKYLSYSPSRAGLMVKTGPRTCPSIEEKVVWFPERVRHSFFLEREGFLTDELYAAGLYMSVPPQKQEEIIHTICGFENAKITRPGYAIAYDFVDPKEINETLETKKIKNLFFAGQINGTTGYDEAAAQGIIAGINASLKVNDKEPFVIKRYEAYIGVMLDDLTHKEINEPYRITPSHVEHRLVLREDNADLRLTEKGRKLGLVDDERYRKYEERLNNIEKGKDIIGKTQIYPNRETLTKLQDLNLPSINKPETLKDLLKRQDITYKDLTVLNDELSYLPDDVLEELEIEVKYEGYIKREINEIKEIKKMESFIFPADFSFSSITSLSKTAIQSLEMHKPKSLGEAIKLQGIKPSDVLTLISVIAKNKELN